MTLLRTVLIGTWTLVSALVSFAVVADEAYSVEEVTPILNKHACHAACKVVRSSSIYNVEPHDLNGDGVSEYLIRTEACGSGGCAEGLFKRDGSVWKKLVEVAVGGLELQRSRTNGFLDVVVWTTTYDPEKRAVRTLYRWDGREYRKD